MTLNSLLALPDTQLAINGRAVHPSHLFVIQYKAILEDISS